LPLPENQGVGSSILPLATIMNKFLNPKKYLNVVKSIYKGYLRSKKNKNLYTLKPVEKKLAKLNNIEELLNFHFTRYTDKSHINFEMFKLVMNYFSGSSLNILETGSSAHGINSSMLFSNYIKVFGGKFDTVDINPTIKKKYEFIQSKNIQFHTNDSLIFLASLDDTSVRNLDFIYLDSFDLDLNNPHPSQEHGLNEFLLIDEKIKEGTIISIDDTPISYDYFSKTESNKYDFVPGKGRLVLTFLEENPGRYDILYHEYSVVLKKL